MTIALRASSAAGGSSAATNLTTLTVTPGVTPTDGDIMFIVINLRKGTDPTPFTVIPTGWTTYQINFAVNTVIATFYKKASSESGNYTFNWTATAGFTWSYCAYSGVSPVTQIDVSGNLSNASSTSQPFPSVTTTVDAETLLCCGAVGGNTTQAWSSWTNSPSIDRTDVDATVNVGGSAIVRIPAPTAGFTLSTTATIAAAAAGQTSTIALKPSRFFYASPLDGLTTSGPAELTANLGSG